ncbi:hypothetical protein ACYATP_02000 [Lactobacillaceae bacterium Melli_B4]
MLKNNHIHQERKIIHKVKHQWVIISAMTLLGTAGITSINVNAASTLTSNPKSTSSLANTTAGYSNAAATLGDAASGAINRLSANISAINSYASIRTKLADNNDANASEAISSVIASAQDASKSAQSAYAQIKVANVIASAANTPGGTLQDGERAASQASAAFTTLMNNLADTDVIVGNMSNAVNQIEKPTSSSANSSSSNTAASSTTSSTTTSQTHSTNTSSGNSNASAKMNVSDQNGEVSSNTNDSQTSQNISTPYTETKATNSAVNAAKQSIATAKRQVKLAKTTKAKAEAIQLLKRAQKNLLITQNNYNYKYYYDFDGPFDTVTTKKTYTYIAIST